MNLLLSTIISTVVLNKDNIGHVNSYGYPVLPGKFAWDTIPNKDNELSACLNHIVNLDYEIEINHDKHRIIDPIIIRNKESTYKLSKLTYDFYHQSADTRFSSYQLETSSSTYKFSHISNVQLYFEQRQCCCKY